MSGNIVLSDDKARLDVARVQGWLASNYWSPGIEQALVVRAIAGSHCLGGYRDGEQVSFARMITDHATFAWLADVWVEASVRGEGLGRQMVQWFVDHPSSRKSGGSGWSRLTRMACTKALVSIHRSGPSGTWNGSGREWPRC